MNAPELHPWLSTPEAVEAARKAVQVPLSLMGAASHAVGTDELFSEALAILTECALPPREHPASTCAVCRGSLEGVRKGAKYCSVRCRKVDTSRRLRGEAEAVAAPPQAHVGAMWSWPEDKIANYAIRTVGYALNNYVRTRKERAEIPDSVNLPNRNVAVADEDDTPRETIEQFLESKGLRVDGTESFEELSAAVHRLLGRTVTEYQEAA